VTAADRPYCEFYDFYSVSPENFGSTLVTCGTRRLFRTNVTSSFIQRDDRFSQSE
jgi:hypothetical protein